MTAAFGLKSGHIGTTKNCIDIAIESYSSAGFVAAAVNDTLVFIAISYRLVVSSGAGTSSERLKSFFRGHYMGQLTRVLLQTGQLYYLCVLSSVLLFCRISIDMPM